MPPEIIIPTFLSLNICLCSIRAANGTAEDGSILSSRVLVIKFIVGKIFCSGAVIMSFTYFKIIGYVFAPKDVRKPSATVSG